MKLATAVFLACVSLSAQQASLEGVAVDSVTQKPLASVHISLISSGVGTNLAEPDDAYGAISKAAGNYSIGNIRPGTYSIEVTIAGYVYVPGTITFNPGERNTGHAIALTPQITITGRVVDEFGDPVEGVAVRALPGADVATTYELRKMSGLTDDRGEYRISGMPGKYLIEAVVHSLRTGRPPEIRTDGSSTTAYATTYYPGSLAKERAKVVEATAGQELTGIDIRVAHRKSLKICGIVTGIPAGGAARAIVTIRVRNGSNEASDDITAGPDGHFLFGNLAPSEYRLQARYASPVTGGDSLQSPVSKVTVETDDASITLPVTAGEQMIGTLRVESDGLLPPAAGNWTVRLTPLEDETAPTGGGQVGADGTFVVSRIIPGVFSLVVDPLPRNAYIKSVLMGGVETLPGDLDLTKGTGGAALSIVVNRNGGQLTGIVTDSNGQPLNVPVFVILADDPHAPATWRTAASTDSTFAFRGVRPGEYHVLAIDPRQFGSGYESLKDVVSGAERLEIKEGARIVKDLRLTGKDDAGAK